MEGAKSAKLKRTPTKAVLAVSLQNSSLGGVTRLFLILKASLTGTRRRIGCGSAAPINGEVDAPDMCQDCFGYITTLDRQERFGTL